jgi:hypothetical protein
MKKNVFLLVVVLFIYGSNALAANGDLIVNGNLGVGTATPQSKLDVKGNISVLIGGIGYTLQYITTSEDVYGAWNLVYSTDTCDGNGNLDYTCPADIGKTCSDRSLHGEGEGQTYSYRTVTCKRALGFVQN